MKHDTLSAGRPDVADLAKAKEAANQVNLRYQYNATGPIEEATIRGKLLETHEYLCTAHDLVVELRLALIGDPAPPSNVATANGPAPSIDQMARFVSSDAACLVAELRTILSRL